MIDNKLSLTFVLPGSTLVSSQECEKNPKESCITHKIMVSETKGKGKNKRTITKPLYVQTRKARTASQHINMSTEAYLHMLNTPVNAKLAKVVKVTKSGPIRAWDLLSEHEKLTHHLDLIAHDLHAISYEYKVLGD